MVKLPWRKLRPGTATSVQDIPWPRRLPGLVGNSTRKLFPWARRSHETVEKTNEPVGGVSSMLGSPIFYFLLLLICLWILFFKKKSDDSKKRSGANIVPVGPSLKEFATGGFMFRPLSKREGFLGIASLPIRRSASNMMRSYDAWRKAHGPTYRVRIPLVSDLVITSDLAVVRDLFQKKNNMYRSTPTLFGRSHLFSGSARDAFGKAVSTILDVPEWRWRKDSLLREFHKTRLTAPDRQLVEYVIRAGKRMCRRLEQAAGDNENHGVVTITPLTVEVASSVIFYFLFGTEVEYDVQEFWGTSLCLLDFFRYRIGSAVHPIFKHVPFTPAYMEERQKRKAWKMMDAVYADQVKMAIANQRKKSQAQTASSSSGGDVALPAFASLLAKEPRYLDRPHAEESLMEETRNLVVAGFETTSNALAFAIGILAERPDIAKLLAVEAKAILGSSTTSDPRVPTRESLEKATISRNLFLEALRLYPLIAAIAGQVGDEDIVVETSDPSVQYFIPRRTPIVFPPRVLQTDPLHVPGTNPLEVDIHRWNDPQTSPPLLTFSMGAHACPGKNLSILEGQIILMMVARQFRFELVEQTFQKDGASACNESKESRLEFEEIAFLRPKNGLALRVFRREPNN